MIHEQDVFFLPLRSCFASLEILVPKEGMLLPENIAATPLNWRLRWSLSHLEPLQPLSPAAELAGGTDVTEGGI